MVFLKSSGLFKQDNAPCRTAKMVQDWFEEHNGINMLIWPLNSPDLSPINLLNMLDSLDPWKLQLTIYKTYSICCGRLGAKVQSTEVSWSPCCDVPFWYRS